MVDVGNLIIDNANVRTWGAVGNGVEYIAGSQRSVEGRRRSKKKGWHSCSDFTTNTNRKASVTRHYVRFNKSLLVH
jgi:hypothetical protein